MAKSHRFALNPAIPAHDLAAVADGQPMTQPAGFDQQALDALDPAKNPHRRDVVEIANQ